MPKAPPTTRPLRGFATIPETPGSKYTPQETIRFQEMFLPQTELYRRRQRQAAIAFLGGGGPFLAALLLNSITHLLLDRAPVPQSWFTPLGILCVISIIIGIGLLWATPALKCPACNCSLDERILTHCPECGSDKLHRNIFGNLCCQSCSKDLEHRRNEGRRYRIHACTGCGVMLDYHGL
ncbi:MAG TPA: hypothetical protein VGH19_05010 [Verrucomicrobiae bacterium]